MVDLDLPRAHRWPLTLRFGPLALRPIERRDAAELRQLRARNREWTGPWDTTVPPQGVPGAWWPNSAPGDVPPRSCRGC
ncbi:Hypothetical protein PFR_JS20-2_397 [Propionibacterium freudenreichii]|nr:Hypothetical protein PFR_JS20-1_397 [Propionibacterium freudenreichii]SCQ79687.1 Hypothetical protein PFR_JS20-2_397 [Propionibacterium freudenreichii]